MNKKRILITGSSGFVGQYIKKIFQPDHIVINWPDNVDIRQPTEVQSVITKVKPDEVLHLAAQSNVPASFDDPKATFDINFIGTYNLLNALKKISFTGKFLYVSSGDVYGIVAEKDLPVDENIIPGPRSPYAVSKLAAEALCYQWSQTEDMSVVIARPFNHIGPGQSQQFVVSSFAKQIVEIKLGRRENKIDVGDIDVSRDFTDVRDVVAAYFALIKLGESGETYNICSGKGRKIRDILYNLLSIADVTANVQTDETRLRRSEQRKVYASCDKLKTTTDWSQSHSLQQSLVDILNYWENKIK